MVKEHEHTKTNPLVILQYVVFGSLILYFGRDVFVPLSFALLISFVIYPSCRWLENKGFKRMIAITINMVLLTLVLAAMVTLLINQLLGFLEEWPNVQSKLIESL